MSSFTPKEMKQLAESGIITPSAFMLYAILDNLQHCHPNDPIIYTRRRFARTYTDSPTPNEARAKRAYDELEALGLIRRAGRAGRALQYWVVPLDGIAYDADGNIKTIDLNTTDSGVCIQPKQCHDTTDSGVCIQPKQCHDTTDSGAYIEYKEDNESFKEREERKGNDAPALTPQANQFLYPDKPAEVIEAAKAQGVAMTEDDALIFLDNYRAKGWMKNNEPVRNWRFLIRPFMDTRKRFTNQNQGGQNGYRQGDNARDTGATASEAEFASDHGFGAYNDFG